VAQIISDGLVVTGRPSFSHAHGLWPPPCAGGKAQISTLTLPALQRAGQNIGQNSRRYEIGRPRNSAGVVEQTALRSIAEFGVLFDLNDSAFRGVGHTRADDRVQAWPSSRSKFPCRFCCACIAAHAACFRQSGSPRPSMVQAGLVEIGAQTFQALPVRPNLRPTDHLVVVAGTPDNSGPHPNACGGAGGSIRGRRRGISASSPTLCRGIMPLTPLRFGCSSCCCSCDCSGEASPSSSSCFVLTGAYRLLLFLSCLLPRHCP